MKKGSGIVIVRKFNDELKFLCLHENMGASSRYDLAKGCIEYGETIKETAVREAFEEAGITNLYFNWDDRFKELGNITMFVAETDQEPNIQPNPHNGILEHDGYEWMSPIDAIIAMPDYLKPFAIWAFTIIGE